MLEVVVVLLVLMAMVAGVVGQFVAYQLLRNVLVMLEELHDTVADLEDAVREV